MDLQVANYVRKARMTITHKAAAVAWANGVRTLWLKGFGSSRSGSSLNRLAFFFLLYAAWVRSRAERPSVSYTKVVMEVAWTGHNLQFTKTN